MCLTCGKIEKEQGAPGGNEVGDYTFCSRILSSVSSLKLTTRACGAQHSLRAASILGTCREGRFLMKGSFLCSDAVYVL